MIVLVQEVVIPEYMVTSKDPSYFLGSEDWLFQRFEVDGRLKKFQFPNLLPIKF
jgi:hypothetical protein